MEKKKSRQSESERGGNKLEERVTGEGGIDEIKRTILVSGMFEHNEQCTHQGLHSFAGKRYELTNKSLCRQGR